MVAIEDFWLLITNRLLQLNPELPILLLYSQCPYRMGLFPVFCCVLDLPRHKELRCVHLGSNITLLGKRIPTFRKNILLYLQDYEVSERHSLNQNICLKNTVYWDAR